MDNLTSKIKDLLNKCLKTSEIEDLKTQLLKLGSLISEFVDENAENEKYISTVLNSKIIIPLSENLFDIYGTNSKKGVILQEFYLNLLEEYSKYLEGFPDYENYILNKVKEKVFKRDYLLSVKVVPKIEIPSTLYFKGIADEYLEKNYKYFKERFSFEGFNENSKGELITYISDLRLALEEINKILPSEEGNLEALENSETPTGIKEYYIDGGIEYFDLGMEYGWSLVNKANEIENYKYQIESLQKLHKKPLKAYPFLEAYEPLKTIPKTVFKGIDYNALDGFLFELKEFLESNVNEEDLKNIFTIKGTVNSSKINLTNGTLSDFGSLMAKLKPFFINSINNRKEYAQWWAGRFTFNSTEKNKKRISNIISALKKGTRQTNKTESINNIVNSLKSILQ